MSQKSSFCINAKSFAAWTGCILCAEIIGGAYFKSVISTIERRFSLPSTTTALLSSSFQLGSMCVVVLVSYFGSRYHRPRSMAIGCLLMILGFFLTIVPQFVGDRYKYIDISTNDTSDATTKHTMTCKLTAPIINDTMKCDDNGKTSATSNQYIFIMVGIMICGVGASPIQPLGYSYIDDHATKHNAAFYIGIVSSIALVAPAIAFVLGAFTLKMWVDVGWVDTSNINISPRHPGWVGAWWIGFIVAIVFLFFASLPLWFFPKEMEKEKETSSDGKQRKVFNAERVKPSLKVESAGGLLAAFKRLLRNKRYLVIVALWTAEGFRMAGLSTFAIKFLEVVFNKSASSSSFVIGVMNLPALVFGTILGSFIIKHWKLEVGGITKLSMFSIAGSTIAYGVTMFIGCDTIPTAGITVPYPASSSSESLELLVGSCNAGCNCEENVYTPVCGPNDITYITPCHAGCTGFETDEFGEIKNYTSCSCLGGAGLQYNQSSVAVGKCTFPYCEDLMWAAVALKTVASFLGGLHVTPLMVLLLRTLKPKDKAFGIGMAYFTFRVLAFLPGPIVFGSVIDSTCLYWTRDPCSSRPYCRIYDNIQYRYGFVGMATATETVAFCIILFYYHKFAKPDEKLIKQEEKEKTATNGGYLATSNGDMAKLLESDADSKKVLVEIEKESII